MAIYHFSVKTISRSSGRSVVASAAYRSGEKLMCDYYGKEQDYTRKSGVEHTQIYAPENTNGELLDRQNLWNTVEKSERRKDALLAREFEIAFPNELNKEQRQVLLNELCQDLVKKHSVIVDAAIHAPHTNGGSDERNYHAHIMFTTRSIDPENGGFSAKKYRDFSRDNGTETVCNWREHFATLTNDHLAKAGFTARVDHRSYEQQNNGLEATKHEGSLVTQLRRMGVKTEISVSNDLIKQRNAEKIENEQLIQSLEHEIYASTKILSDLQQAKVKLDAQLTQEKEKQRQAAQTQQIETAYHDFIQQQSQYAEFAEKFYKLGKHVNNQLATLDKNLVKSEKWLSKQIFYYSAGLFYDNYHHKQLDVDVPAFFITNFKIAAEKEKLMRLYNQDVFDLAKKLDIENTVSALQENAKMLQDNSIELPVTQPTFMQKLKNEYVHSFDTLNDFFTHMTPVFEVHRADTRKAEKEQLQARNKIRREEEIRRQIETEKRKRDDEYDLELKQRLETQQRKKIYWESEPEKKKSSKDNDNDFSM